MERTKSKAKENEAFIAEGLEGKRGKLSAPGPKPKALLREIPGTDMRSSSNRGPSGSDRRCLELSSNVKP